MCQCVCGMRVYATRRVDVRCTACGEQIVCAGDVRPGQLLIQSVPREQWPAWANIIARYSKPQDAGVGDTAQRIAARFGGEWFKWLSGKIGIPCGCTQRQEEWDRLYPYDF